MKNYALPAVILAGIAALMWIHAERADEALLYIGDCVDIVADRDGLQASPRVIWDTYAQYCADRYNNR